MSIDPPIRPIIHSTYYIRENYNKLVPTWKFWIDRFFPYENDGFTTTQRMHACFDILPKCYQACGALLAAPKFPYMLKG